MKIDVTEVNAVKRTMRVEVDDGELAKERDSVIRGYAQKASIPGFRPGKVPLGVVRQRFAKEIREDVRERVISRYYREAAREKGLDPIGDPILDDVTHEDGVPFSFQTSFEILPRVEVTGYREVEVRRPAVTVSDADVDKTLEELRQSRTQLVTEENREAVTGDVIVADIEGSPQGAEAFKREGMLLEIGATDNLPAFNDHLLGTRAGDEREFSVDYPEEYAGKDIAGKTVRYRVAVHEVKRKEVPDIDDEFAKDLGDFDDLAALRARIREDLEARGEREADNAVRQSVLDKVLLANPVVLPEILVENEIRQRLEEIVRRMMAQGIDPEKAELDWKALRAQQEEPAGKSVHARLILDAVARAESVDVTDAEVEERLRRDAQAMGENVQKLRAHMQEHGGVEALKIQLVREKSLDLLTSVANIQTEE